MQFAFPEVAEEAGCSVDSENEKSGGTAKYLKK
jgi:hypothetical protein